jgi:hypothetical protein
MVVMLKQEMTWFFMPLMPDHIKAIYEKYADPTSPAVPFAQQSLMTKPSQVSLQHVAYAFFADGRAIRRPL